MDGFYKFCNPTSLFTCNHFEWLFYLHLKKLFFFVKGTPTLSLSFWFVDKQWPLSCNARLCHKERNGMLHNRESRKSRLYIAQVKYKKMYKELKDDFLASVLFTFLYNSNLKESIQNAISWRSFTILKWNFQMYLILHVSCIVEKK